MRGEKSSSKLVRPLYLTFEESEWGTMQALFDACRVRTMKNAILKAADNYVRVEPQEATA
jgi:hypothetical protein